jgi:glycosyltransferase involved in cell wall biosynthesis
MPGVYLLLKGLVDEGFQIHWLLIGRDSLQRETFELLDGRIRVTCCTPPWAALIDRISSTRLCYLKLSQWGYGCCAVRKALRLLRRTSVGLIYGATPLGAAVAGVVARLRRLPRISRLYGTFLSYYVLAGRLSWLCPSYPVEAAVFRRPGEALVVTNDGTRGDRVAGYYKTDPEKMYFLLNGVDKDSAPPPAHDLIAVRERLGIGAQTVLLVTVSRLARWKRVDRAVGAMAGLRRLGLDCRLLVVGEGPERPNLEAQARSAGVDHLVTFVGELAHQDAMAILHSAGLFLSLFDYSNLGNPLIEAMMAGRCIVSIRDGSLDGILTDGENAILIEPKTLESDLPQRLGELIRDAALRECLGQAARETAHATFWSWNQRIAAEIDMIKTLCAGQRPDKTRWMEKWAHALKAPAGSASTDSRQG